MSTQCSPEPLGFEALRALTEMPFPEDFAQDEDTGELCVEADTREILARFFEFFGLRLPTAARADTVHDLWQVLRLKYGQAVRLAARGRGDIAMVCPELTATELAYAAAVGKQDRETARQLAKSLFTGRDRVIFLA